MNTVVGYQDMKDTEFEIDVEFDDDVASAKTVNAITVKCNTDPEIAVMSKDKLLQHYTRQYGVSDVRDVYKMLTASWKIWLSIAQDYVKQARNTPNHFDMYIRQIGIARANAGKLLRIREEIVCDVMVAAATLERFIATGARCASCSECNGTVYSGDNHHECMPHS